MTDRSRHPYKPPKNEHRNETDALQRLKDSVNNVKDKVNDIVDIGSEGRSGESTTPVFTPPESYKPISGLPFLNRNTVPTLPANFYIYQKGKEGDKKQKPSFLKRWKDTMGRLTFSGGAARASVTGAASYKDKYNADGAISESEQFGIDDYFNPGGNTDLTDYYATPEGQANLLLTKQLSGSVGLYNWSDQYLMYTDEDIYNIIDEIAGTDEDDKNSWLNGRDAKNYYEDWWEEVSATEESRIAYFGHAYWDSQEDFDKELENHNAVFDYYKASFEKTKAVNADGEIIHIEQIKANAELPPWVKNTKENQYKWDLYKAYVRGLNERSVKAIEEAQEEAANYTASKVAGMDSNAEDSLSRAAIGGASTVGSGIDYSNITPATASPTSIQMSLNQSKSFQEGSDDLKNYFRDYWFNPLKNGDFGVFLWNRAWSFLDTMDIVARGSRAFLAGSQSIGGMVDNEEGNLFKGQSVYWYSDDEKDKEAQKLLMENGGYQLYQLRNSQKDDRSFDDKTVKELEKKLNKAFKDSGYDWEDVYTKVFDGYKGFSLSKAFKNVKETYTDYSADFMPETGNLAADLVLGAFTDPGLLIGGGAKAIVSGSTRSMTKKAAVEASKDVVGGLSSYRQLPKEVRRAINTFRKRNGGKNLIFLNPDKLKTDLDWLTKKLTDLKFIGEADQVQFKTKMFDSITNKSNDMNANIVAASPDAQQEYSNKLLQYAYHVDKGIDAIDNALIKVCFPEPFLLKGMGFLGREYFYAVPFTRDLYIKRQIKKALKTQQEIEGLRSNTNTASIDKFNDWVNEREKRVEYVDTPEGTQIVDTEGNVIGIVNPDNTVTVDINSWAMRYFDKPDSPDIVDLAKDVTGEAIPDYQKDLSKYVNSFNDAEHNISVARNKFLSGQLSKEELEVTLQKELNYIVGGDADISEPDDIIPYITSTDGHHIQAGDIGESFQRFKRSYETVEQIIERKNVVNRDLFISELSGVKSIEDLQSVLNKYYGRVDDLSNFKINDYLINFEGEINDLEYSNLLLNAEIYRTELVAQQTARVKGTESITSSLTDKNSLEQKIKDSSSKFGEYVEIKPKKNTEIYDEIVNTLNLDFRIDDPDIPEYLSKLRAFLDTHDEFFIEDILPIIRDTIKEAELGWALSNTKWLKRIKDRRYLHDLRLLYRKLNKAFVSMEGEAIYRFQIDKLASYINITQDSRVTAVLEDFYNNSLRPIIRDYLNMTIDEGDHVLFREVYANLENFYNLRQNNNLFQSLVNKLSYENSGIPSEVSQSIIDSLFSFVHTTSIRDVLQDMRSSRSSIEAGIKTAIYSDFGEAKLGMRSARIRLMNNEDSIYAAFKHEIDNDSELAEWIDELEDLNVADPATYTKLQLLQNILLDKDAVKEYNKLSKEMPVVFTHLATNSLSARSGSVLGVGYTVWKELPDDYTLRDVFESFIKTEDKDVSGTFFKNFSSEDLEYFDGQVLQSMFDYDQNMAHLPREKQLEMLQEVSTGSENPTLDFLGFIQKLKQGYPSDREAKLVVHDFEGFNISFLKGDLSQINFEELSSGYQSIFNKLDIDTLVENSSNSFKKLRDIIGDHQLSDDELQYVVQSIYKTAEEMQSYNQTFDFLDLSDLFRTFKELKRSVDACKNKGISNSILKDLTEAFDSIDFDTLSNGLSEAMSDTAKLYNTAKRYYLRSRLSSPKEITGITTTKGEALDYISDRQFELVNNIAKKLNLDLILDYDPESSFGGWSERGTSKVLLNTEVAAAYYTRTFCHVYLHELKHAFRNYNMNDAVINAQKIYAKVLSLGDSASVDLVNAISSKRQIDAYSVLSIDGLFEEVLAESFAFYLEDPVNLARMKNYILTNIPDSQKDIVSEVLDNLAELSNLETRQSVTNTGLANYEAALLNTKLSKYPELQDDLFEYYVNNLKCFLEHHEKVNSKIKEAVLSSNPIKQANKDTGSYKAVNFKEKCDIEFQRTCFDSDAFGIGRGSKKFTYEDFLKRNNFAKQIHHQKTYNMVRTAEELLRPHKDEFDSYIQLAKNIANSVSYHNSFTYLCDIKIPESAVESYLFARALYDDHLKFILDPALKMEYDQAFKKNFKDNNEIRQFMDDFRAQLELRAVDDIDPTLLSFFARDLDSGLFTSLREGVNSDVLALLKGESDDVLFVNTPKGIANKRKEGISAASELRNATQRIKNDASDLDYSWDVLNAHGFSGEKDYRLGALYQTFLDLVETKVAKALHSDKRVDNFFKDVYSWRENYEAWYTIKKLKTGDKFDIDKIIGELLWNGTNRIVLNKSLHDADNINYLIDYINKLGYPFLTIETTAYDCKLSIKEGATMISGEVDGEPVRFIRDFEGNRVGDYDYEFKYKRPQYESIPYPELEEIYDTSKHGLSLEDYKEMYNIMLKMEGDLELYSNGAVRGTLGRVMSNTDLDNYLTTIQDSSPGILDPRASFNVLYNDNVVFDPGFITARPTDNYGVDYFNNLANALHGYSVKAKSPLLFTNMLYNERYLRCSYLFENYSNRDVFEFLKTHDDFVVIDLKVNSNTHSGFELNFVKPKIEGEVELLRHGNQMVLPYDLAVKLRDKYNIMKDPGLPYSLMSKWLLMFKASRLCNPNTWITNLLDGQLKAATTDGEDASNILVMGTYNLKAVRDISEMNRLLNQYNIDPNMTISEWEKFAMLHSSSLSFEDFQLLLGIMNENNKYIGNKDYRYVHKKDINLSNGTEAFFDNLSHGEINRLWKVAYHNEVPPISKKDFINLFSGKTELTEDVKKAYNDIRRKLMSVSGDALTTADFRLSQTLFKPFNYTEYIIRYSQLLYLRDMQGANSAEALRKLHRAQFDINDVSSGIKRLEYVIPFVSFQMKNLEYWMGMVERNPRLFRYFERLYGPVNSDHIDKMLEEDDEYSIASDNFWKLGGIPIGGSDGMYFKIKPSILDAFTKFYNVGSWFESSSPLVSMFTKYSLTQLGLDSNKYFKELDLRYGLDNFIDDAAALIPVLNMIYSEYSARFSFDDYRFENVEGVLDNFLLLICPKIFGFDPNKYPYQQDFEDYQKELEEHGMWYDSNTRTVRLLKNKNTFGLNNPDLTFDERSRIMRIKYNKVWDANIRNYVDPDKVTEGGFNQVFDFENDPDAWDKLCAEYKKIGKVWDANVRKFVKEEDLSPGKLNDPDLDPKKDFDKIKDYYKELFDLEWDANQNAFVDKDHYIPGGLNNTDNFYQVMAYRKAIYGEEYDKNSKHFYKTSEPSVVTLESLACSSDWDDYYSVLGLSRIAQVAGDLRVKNGLLVTKDGKYVLLNDKDYNDRVLSQFAMGYRTGSGYHRKHFSKQKRSYSKITKQVTHTMRDAINYKSNYDFYNDSFSLNSSYRSTRINNKSYHFKFGRMYSYQYYYRGANGRFDRFTYYNR